MPPKGKRKGKKRKKSTEKGQVLQEFLFKKDWAAVRFYKSLSPKGQTSVKWIMAYVACMFLFALLFGKTTQ